MKDYVVLVNSEDQDIGEMEKMEAHQKGVLHRAFSVFLFNSHGETLLQRRSFSKYHSPLLWTNSCCSHPRKGEGLVEAANRRLGEELGIPMDLDLKLEKSFSFTYRAEFNNGLIEHELDHVLSGFIDDYNFSFDKEEVEAVRWVTLNELSLDIDKFPERYTEWFKIILNEYINYFSL
jgi:isopentenyl-diphosphate delta-isomerase|tara:strand:+ start:16371 stop:16901 length:531 start_codon:yes stop_codon:yes gene_type:complete